MCSCTVVHVCALAMVASLEIKAPKKATRKQGLSYYKRSPQTVDGRIIVPPWDHPWHCKQSPLTVNGLPSCSLQTVNYEARKHSLKFRTRIGGQSPTILAPRSFSILYTCICIVFQIFTQHPLRRFFSNGIGVISPSCILQQMLPHLVLI